MDDMLPRSKAAKELNVSTTMVRKLEAQGKLDPIKHEGRTYYDPQQVTQLEFDRAVERRKRETIRAQKEQESADKKETTGSSEWEPHDLTSARRKRDERIDESARVEKDRLREQSAMTLETRRLDRSIAALRKDLKGDRRTVRTSASEENMVSRMLPFIAFGALAYLMAPTARSTPSVEPQPGPDSPKHTVPPTKEQLTEMIRGLKRWQETAP